VTAFRLRHALNLPHPRDEATVDLVEARSAVLGDPLHELHRPDGGRLLSGSSLLRVIWHSLGVVWLWLAESKKRSRDAQAIGEALEHRQRRGMTDAALEVADVRL
jgi:hypothetical protein